MRKIKPISIIQPLQMSTVELIPNSYIEGSIGSAVNVQGNALAGKIVLSRNTNMPLADGNYRITVVSPTNWKATNLKSGQEITGLTYGATALGNVLPGININVTDSTGLTVGDYADFTVLGDQTYIIPGTILGRMKTGVNVGKWRPVRLSDVNDKDNYDAYRIAQSTKETDKTKTVLESGYETNISQVYITDVIVFAEIIESACTAINMNATIKALVSGIAWI